MKTEGTDNAVRTLRWVRLMLLLTRALSTTRPRVPHRVLDVLWTYVSRWQAQDASQLPMNTWEPDPPPAADPATPAPADDTWDTLGLEPIGELVDELIALDPPPEPEQPATTQDPHSKASAQGRMSARASSTGHDQEDDRRSDGQKPGQRGRRATVIVVGVAVLAAAVAVTVVTGDFRALVGLAVVLTTGCAFVKAVALAGWGALGAPDRGDHDAPGET